MATPPHIEAEKQSINVAELEGSLLGSRSPFPYFMVVALEACGPVRALLLLFMAPLVVFLRLLRLEEAALRLMTFVSTAGVPVGELKAVAKAVLPRFYLEDLCPGAWETFAGCKGRRCVVTASPRILVEPFLREYLDVDFVVGTELRTTEGGRCLGVAAPASGVVGGGRIGDHSLLSSFTKHNYTSSEAASTAPRKSYPKPLIFHDGRLVPRPTPLISFTILLWFPFGAFLVALRIFLGLAMPYRLSPLSSALTGLRIRAQFHEAQPTPNWAPPKGPAHKKGTLYAANHRTLLDPVMISTALQRRVTAVTYSLSPVSEVISPIPTVRLSRDRSKDGATMRALLDGGDLVVCPEGTTCREPYLLRFSPLFAEIADNIVPVAITTWGSMFYGTTVRGYKALDSAFFLMNPSPLYQLKFLERIALGSDSSSSYDTANNIQRSIARAIGFECTDLTRRDKYRMLAGHDGVSSRN